MREHAQRHAGTKANAPSPGQGYVLEDGSALKRINTETFQILATGAYITVVRE